MCVYKYVYLSIVVVQRNVCIYTCVYIVLYTYVCMYTYVFCWGAGCRFYFWSQLDNVMSEEGGTWRKLLPQTFLTVAPFWLSERWIHPIVITTRAPGGGRGTPHPTHHALALSMKNQGNSLTRRPNNPAKNRKNTDFHCFDIFIQARGLPRARTTFWNYRSWSS